MAYERLVSVSQTATSGQVPTADGTGGYTWNTPSSSGGGSTANEWEEVEAGTVTDATTIAYNGQADGLANYKLILYNFVPSDTSAKNVALQEYGQNDNVIVDNNYYLLAKFSTSGSYKFITMITEMLNATLPSNLVYHVVGNTRTSGNVQCHNQYNNIYNNVTGLKGIVFGFTDNAITFSCDYQIWRKNV